MPRNMMWLVVVLKDAGTLNEYSYQPFVGSGFGRLKKRLRATAPIRVAPVTEAVVFTKTVMLSPAVLLLSRYTHKLKYGVAPCVFE